MVLQDLLALIEDLNLTIKTLSAEIDTLKSEIAKLNTELKRAGEDREKQNDADLKAATGVRAKEAADFAKFGCSCACSNGHLQHQQDEPGIVYHHGGSKDDIKHKDFCVEEWRSQLQR